MAIEKTGEEKARETRDRLAHDVEAKKEMDVKETKEVIQTLAERSEAIANIYRGEESVGTEEVGAEELNIPSLKLVQGNKRPQLADGSKAEEGNWYRTDIQEQAKSYDVTLLVFRKTMGLNYKKDAQERKHIYFGLYAHTTEPFRMYCRGWSLSGSRAFLTEVKRLQAKYKIPMFALMVRMKSEGKTGTTDDGADYSINSAVFEIIKGEDGLPIVETNADRVKILREFVDRFMTVNVEGTDEDSDVQNNKLNKVMPQQEAPDDDPDGDGMAF
jgi:hypothetical protein